jgi:hypothetical protein
MSSSVAQSARLSRGIDFHSGARPRRYWWHHALVTVAVISAMVFEDDVDVADGQAALRELTGIDGRSRVARTKAVAVSKNEPSRS